MANWERCLVVLLRGREAIAARTRAAEAVLALDPEAALFLSDTGTQPEELRERFRQARLLLDNAWFYCRASQPLCDAREFSALLGPAQPPPDRKEAGRKLRRALDALDLCAVDQDLDALLVLLWGRGLSPREARAFLLGLYREANRHLQNFFSGVTLGEEGILRMERPQTSKRPSKFCGKRCTAPCSARAPPPPQTFASASSASLRTTTPGSLCA